MRFRLPILNGLENNMCAKYARLSTKKLLGAHYVPGNSWKLGKNNHIIARVNKDLNSYIDLMVPNETIVVFYNPSSSFNEDGRVGTHSALFIGYQDGDIQFAEQNVGRQIISKYSIMQKRGLDAREILAPAG